LTKQDKAITSPLITYLIKKDKGTEDMGEKSKGRKEQKKQPKLSQKDKRKAKKEKNK
jgi:hypothetical protein